MKTQDYLHPKSDKILEETLQILSYSDIAQRYLDTHTPSTHILKGPLAQGFAPDAENVYLRVPALQETGRVEQALDLIGVYIRIKLHSSRATDLPDDPSETLTAQHLQNIELILNIFPIAQELEEHGYQAIHSLRLMGLGKLFQAWKTGASYDEYVSIYWSMFNDDEGNIQDASNTDE